MVFFLFATSIGFIIDVCAFLITGQIISNLVPLVYCRSLQAPVAWAALIPLMLVMALQSQLYFDCLGANLLFILPLTIIFLPLQQLFALHTIFCSSMITVFILVQNHVFTPYWLGTTVDIRYTLVSICATILIGIISLTYAGRGKMGNRVQ